MKLPFHSVSWIYEVMTIFYSVLGTRGTPQLLRSLPVLAEDPGSVVQHPQQVAHNHVHLQFWGSLYLLMAFKDACTHKVHKRGTHIIHLNKY